MRKSAPLLVLVLLCGCATNPVTGRDQIVSFPAIQAHADIIYTLTTGAPLTAEAGSGDEMCRDEDLRFAADVKRIGAELEAAARELSPELFDRIDAFQIAVNGELGTGTGSSAGGRIVLGAGLARLAPADEVTAFLIAREMAHVIARHDEENSGVRLFFSAISSFFPVTLIARLLVSTLGSGALTQSWAGQQRREADEVALTLLERSGRSAASVAERLAKSLKTNPLPATDWSARYIESIERVNLLAGPPPRLAAKSD